MLSATAFIAVFAGAVLAQDPSTKYESSLNMTINTANIQPASQEPLIVAGWCNAQTDTCSTLCGGPTSTNLNSCDSTTLKWTCTCSANNSQPGLQYYTQTMPTFICEELFTECNRDNAGNHDLQQECIKNIQDLCATQSPPKQPVVPNGSGSGSSSGSSSTTTMATKTSMSATQSATAAATSSTSSGFAAPTMAPGGGVGVAAAIGLVAYLL